ncbi:MAG: zinc ribbon domain-containing protein [Candidatus Lutacidiplasmatales archaeon]
MIYLQPQRICPRCGRALHPDVRFCPYCGNALG